MQREDAANYLLGVQIAECEQKIGRAIATAADDSMPSDVFAIATMSVAVRTAFKLAELEGKSPGEFARELFEIAWADVAEAMRSLIPLA